MEINYEEIGKQIGALVNEKQKAYGDSFGKSSVILQQIFPNGVKPENYDDMLFIARILDKLFRIANDKNAFGEDAFKDIAGYSVLAMGKNKRDK
jgi:hypothetical protein